MQPHAAIAPSVRKMAARLRGRGVRVVALFLACAHGLSPSPISRRQALMRSFAATVGAPALALPYAAVAVADDTSDVASPTAAMGEDEIGTLRRAYDALDRAQPELAEPLLGECIDTWTRAGMPSVEIASLHRLRGSARLQLERLPDALSDLDVAFELATKDGATDELLQVLQVRANALEAQADWRRADADLSALLSREQELSVAGPNPFLRMRRARARQELGNYRGAAADLEEAEVELLAIGDRIRAVLAACALALALFGANDSAAALATTVSCAAPCRCWPSLIGLSLKACALPPTSCARPHANDVEGARVPRVHASGLEQPGRPASARGALKARGRAPPRARQPHRRRAPSTERCGDGARGRGVGRRLLAPCCLR